MPLELYLIGLGHYDLKGPERLQKLLQKISPDIVSVEYNPHTVIHLNIIEKARKSQEGIQALIEDWRRKGNYDSETLRQFIPILNYEYFVAKEYCNKNNKSLIFSDLGDIDIGQRWFHYTMSIPVEVTQQQIETAYHSEVITVPPVEIPNLIKRDVYTETILRALQGKVAHIVGAWHLFGNYHNLYERMKDLNPIRIMLHQADALP